MKKKTIKLTLYTLLMLLVPTYFWSSAYQWELSENLQHLPEITRWIQLTYTASMPYALGTSVVLLAILLFVTRHSYPYKTVLLVFALSMAGTQVMKSSIKNIVKEPRPYVAAIDRSGVPVFLGYDAHSFYQQDKTVQYQIIEKFADASPELTKNFQSELGYSFPSGHTIFAVSWLLLFAGFTWRKAAWILPPIMTIWAWAVLYSRVRLGMHYPIDLVVATLIAWLWHLFLFINLLPNLKRKF